MNTQEVIDLFGQYVIGNYGRLPKVIVKGQGSVMTDLEGNEILDMFPGWAVSGIGHCHPKVVEAIQKQVAELIHMDNTFYTLPQGRLAKLLSERAFGGQCFFCNSGAEANEAALKLARKYAGGKKYKFITTEKSFHGRTFAAVTATGQPKYHDGFLPLVPGFEYVPFNDIDALTEAFSEETAAVLVEPIQGEGGIHPASAEYLHTIRDLCDQSGALMILDEVQTGMGRTGQWFAYQHADVIPDIITLAKALGGGTAIGAMMARPEIAAALVPGTHASTFGGNPVAARAAIATLKIILEQGFLDDVRRRAAYLGDKLSELKRSFDCIADVRGMGMIWGVEYDRDIPDMVARLQGRGLLVNSIANRILRLLPPLTVSVEEIDAAVERISDMTAEIARN